jgi:homoserine dehydrogenase
VGPTGEGEANYGAIRDTQRMPLRIWLVGFGTVGQWLVRVLDSQAERLAAQYGVRFSVVGLANARDGFIHDGDGLDLGAVLGLASRGRSIAELPGVQRWPSALEGLRATEADLLVEVAASPSADGDPGFAHMREALERAIPVVTSNKWPVALHGVALASLARKRGVALRAESTVMSGTPLLAALVDGLAGAVPIGLRGLLNATANFILSRMNEGASYEDALAEAQAAGLAERDPAADVEGPDTVAKVMILSGLVFGRQLRLEQVACSGIVDIARSEFDRAASTGGRVKHVATLEFSEPGGAGDVSARVAPELVAPEDPLANVEGTTNAVVCRASPLGEVTVTGPGAGPELAGQGVLSDLIGVARWRARD